MPLTALLDGAVLAERTGSGTTSVLALHGWGRSRADLLPALTDLSALSVDLPGFGASPPPPAPWGSADYADALAPALTSPVVVVGHSFGGRVAVQLAARHPSLVSGLVLTGTPLLRATGTTGRAPLAFRMAKSLHAAGILSSERMEAQRRQHGSADYRNASGVMRECLVRLVNEDYRDLLPGITVPVAMVWGSDDTAAPLTMAREAERLLPSATLTVSEGSGHLLDAPLLALLRGALASGAAA